MEHESGILINQETFTAKIQSKHDFREIMERLANERLVIFKYH